MKFLEYYAFLLILHLDFEIASARDNLTYLHIVKNIFSISSLYIFFKSGRIHIEANCRSVSRLVR